MRTAGGDQPQRCVGGGQCWGAGEKGAVGECGKDKFGVKGLKTERKPTLDETTRAQKKMEELYSQPVQIQRKMDHTGHFSAPDLTISLG